jgi:hypothetical protein
VNGRATPKFSSSRKGLQPVRRFAQNLQKPGRVAYIRSVAQEALWRVRSEPVPPLALAWPLASDSLERVVLRWPSAYNRHGAGRWVNTLLAGLQRYVKIELRDLPQPFANVVMIQMRLHGKSHDVAIDYADRSEIDRECRRVCALYFKMQFLRGGYHDEGIVPGGFPASASTLYAYLSRLRRLRAQQRFTSDVYGRFSRRYAIDTRSKAVALLSDQKIFRYEGGLEVIRYSRYLTDVARARICIDLPGNGDFCFRLIDYLAIGSCVIGPRHSTALHAPLTDRANIIYCADDLSDLVPLCAEYLERGDAREQIAQAARLHFDKYLEPRQWAAYYLYTLLQRFD